VPSRSLRFIRRLGVAASIAALLLSTVGLGVSVAANSRLVFFGSPDGFGGRVDSTTLFPGELAFSTLTTDAVPGRTAVEVKIWNRGLQTLNHVKWAGGSVADGLPYNPSFTVDGTDPTDEWPDDRPAGKSFPANVTFNGAFNGASPSANCPPTLDGDGNIIGILCTVGTLAAGDFVTYTLVFTPDAPLQADFAGHVWLTVSWNEGWSATGSNADYAFAEGDIKVTPTNCDTESTGYFLPNDNIGIAANGFKPCQKLGAQQAASIASGKALGAGLAGFATVLINDDADTYAAECPPALKNKCYGVTVEASVLEGATIDGGVEWTVRWFGVKSLSGAVHLPKDYVAPTPSSPGSPDCAVSNIAGCYTLIPFSKDNVCVDTLTTTDLNCWKAGTKFPSPGGVKPVWFQITFRTPDNGRGGGYT
jgi:hypothetical protein